jgi:hypothetical protein
MFTNDPYGFVGAAMVKEVYRATRRGTAALSQAVTEREPKRRYLVDWLLTKLRLQKPGDRHPWRQECGTGHG